MKSIQDLERIRMLQNRIRKKPNDLKKQDDQQKSLNQNQKPNQSSLKLNTQKGAIQNKKIFPNFVQPLIIVQKKQQQIESNNIDLEIPQKNNRKLTQYYPKKKIKTEKQQAKQKQREKTIEKSLIKQMPKQQLESIRKLTEQKQKIQQSYKEKLISYQSVFQQNKVLRQKIKQKDETYNNFKKKMKQMIVNYVIQNHKLKRNQIRAKISANKIRLGQFVTYRQNSKTQELWVDGHQIRSLKQKLDQINNQKQELEKLKKNIKPKKNQQQLDSDVLEKKNSYTCQLMMLSKQQAHLKQQLIKLQEEKSLHMKQYKRLYQEQHSKYGRPNPQTGIVTWQRISSFQLLCLLGKGGFSQVYKAFDTEQLREAACKIHEFSPSWSEQAKQNYIKHALRENSVHKKLQHPNIVKLYNTVEIDNTSFCTVLEYCDGPDLSFYLKKYKTIQQKQAKLLIRQVMNAIKYLHQLPQKVIHYDLKPQNILFHNGQIKITDFGLCKIMNEEVTKMQLTSQGVGTYWYLPPECFLTDQRPTISTKVDIWSIGVIYFEMLYGQKPFGQNMSQVKILKQGIILKSVNVQFPAKPAVTNESKQFIKQCLMYKQQDRFDITEALKHPVFDKK